MGKRRKAKRRRRKPSQSKGPKGTQLPPQVIAAVHVAQGITTIWEALNAHQQELQLMRMTLNRLEAEDPGFLDEVFNPVMQEIAVKLGIDLGDEQVVKAAPAPVEVEVRDLTEPIGRVANSSLDTDILQLEHPDAVKKLRGGDLIGLSVTPHRSDLRKGSLEVLELDPDAGHLRTDVPISQAIPTAARGDFVVHLFPRAGDEEE